MIGSAKLNKRITFQKASEVADGGGGFTLTWGEQFTVWGGFTLPRLSARMEAISAGVVQTVKAGELVVRDSRNTRKITETWRGVVTTDPTVSPTEFQTWNIRKVYPRENDGFIRMEVEAGVAT